MKPELKFNGINVEINELKEELKELRQDFKHWLEQTNVINQDIAKLLAKHDNQIENLGVIIEKQDKEHEGLVLKLWGLAAATFLAIIAALLSFVLR